MSDNSEAGSAITIDRRGSHVVASFKRCREEFSMRKIDTDTQDFLPHEHEHAAAADRAAKGLLAFMANLLGAFTTVDPRVITRQERRNGRTALRF